MNPIKTIIIRSVSLYTHFIRVIKLSMLYARY